MDRHTQALNYRPVIRNKSKVGAVGLGNPEIKKTLTANQMIYMNFGVSKEMTERHETRRICLRDV